LAGNLVVLHLSAAGTTSTAGTAGTAIAGAFFGPFGPGRFGFGGRGRLIGCGHGWF
jgi:hypothetical protein